MTTTEISVDLCICCGKKPVTWPRVCEDCIDHEAQAALALEYGIYVEEGPFGEEISSTGYECRSCGMIYDGGMRCTYCGDSNPLDDSELDEEL
jgi:hypothetical protein